MSPPALRRYRAERILRRDFQSVRARVLGAAGARLARSGVKLDVRDLEACYSLAWHGLYEALLQGERIESPVGWLTVVTFRRALDEHRSRARAGTVAEWEPDRGPPEDPDLAARLDDRERLGALFEGMREALTPREREAAVLCYLHGLSRAEAASRMGLSDGRMRKLMEGRDGAPGVAAKLGALAGTIEAGRWCEQRASLMRAFAYGILDPDGERHRLALIHHRRCPSCRAYVASLRGLAVLLPPAGLPLSMLAGACGGSAAAGTGAASGSTAAGVGATAGSAAATGAAAGGVAGVGGLSGGGWLLAGGPPAKLALGCLLALGVGAGCVAIERSGRPRRGNETAARSGSPRVRAKPVTLGAAGAGPAVAALAATPAAPPRVSEGRDASTQGTGAEREFGLASVSASGRRGGGAQPSAPPARTAGRSPRARLAGEAALAESARAAASVAQPSPTSGAGTQGMSSAEREFAPG